MFPSPRIQWLAVCIMGTTLLAAQERQALTTPLYSDENLLPHTTSHLAPTMLLPLFVKTKAGTAPREFTKKDFVLLVDGKPTKAKVMRPWDEGNMSRKDGEITNVLLVLPPNQPLLHNMATEDAIRYFSKQQADRSGRLPWNISLFDSNEKQTAYTRDKAELLAELADIKKSIEPLQRDADLGGNWLDDARNAIYRMRFLPGRRIVIAFNPQFEPIYGLLELSLMQTDPSDLVGVAERAGAQVYIANSTGPAFVGPTESGLNTALVGMQISNMMQTSQLTGAGYANTLKDLFGQIIAERDISYVLKFGLDAEELDDTSLDVKVRITNRNLKVVVLQAFPAPSSLSQTAAMSSHERAPRSIRDALNKRIPSSELQIAQHVDYFPERKGTKAFLPFSCALIWTGHEVPPEKLIVVERVEQAESGFVVSAYKLTLLWNGRFASWERDNKLSSGKYQWKVAVASGDGKVIASATTDVTVPRPSDANAQLSTIVTGLNCRSSVQDKTQSMAGLRQRGVNLKNQSEKPIDLGMDPMLENKCLLEPNPTLFYKKTNTLRALVRVYLTDKIDKGRLDAWKATFKLLDQTGRMEAEQSTSLSVDSAPGYLASMQMPLNGKDIGAGIHILRFELRGPTVKKTLIQTTAIMIE